MKNKIKIIVNTFPTLSETFIFNLVLGLEDSGFDVEVIAFKKSIHNSFFKDKMFNWSGNLTILPYTNYFSFSNLIQIGFILISNPGDLYTFVKRDGLKRGLTNVINLFYLKKGSPNIIHFGFSAIAIPFLDCFEKLPGIIKITSCRGTAEKVKPFLSQKNYSNLKNVIEKSDCIHCVSDDLARHLKQFGLTSSKVFINRPAIDSNYFVKQNLRIEDKSQIIKILSTGRLHFSKGYVYALLAVKELLNKGYNIEYNIIGDGSEYEQICFQIVDLELQGRVNLLGKMGSSSIVKYLNETDIFLLSSIYEGISNSVLEAMCIGLPIVSTKAGGMAEVIANGVNGILVEKYDPISIANAISNLIDSKKLRDYLGTNAIQTIHEKFNSKLQIELFIKHYEFLMK